MTWVLGGFAELIAAPAAALHPIPDGLRFAGAAMAEPLAACVHAVARGRVATREAAVLGGGTMGLMIARLLVLDGPRRDASATATPSAARRPRRSARAPSPRSSSHALVFEAVGPARGVARRGRGRARPAATVVLVGGCPGGTDVALPTGPLHYDELDVRGAFHHSRAEVDRALDAARHRRGRLARARGRRRSASTTSRAALRRPAAGEARKLVVDPRR